MGWGSATALFDGAVDVALSYAPKVYNMDTRKHYPSEEMVKAVVHDMYTKIRWEDWDTQDESKYADVLNEIRIELGEIEPEEECPKCHNNNGDFILDGTRTRGYCYDCGYEMIPEGGESD